MTRRITIPRGLYDPRTEHDGCGVGFVANIRGVRSHSIVAQGLEMLRRLSHRGATGCDPRSGDGAGVLLQLPHEFFKKEAEKLGFGELRRKRYGVGLIFLPADPTRKAACEEIFEEVVTDEGQQLVGWRDVPIDPSHCGPLADSVRPVIRQAIVRMRRLPPAAFERKLYVIRKLTQRRIGQRGVDPEGRFHIASLSTETLVYKGLLLPDQLAGFYRDLENPALQSAIALVHSRFSTNTFPTWDLAQPFHYIAHNGEINTLRGNRNWMAARRSQLQSAKFGGPLDRLFPIIVPGKSDSAQFDNMLELLHLGGRSVPHAIMMLIPEAWEADDQMDQERRCFYEYSSSLMEPWDGPAAIAFSDGQLVGATLDRNGLRPARYLVTTDDRVILASETGVLDIPPTQVKHKGRLRPGKIFVVDTNEGRILDDAEVKRDIARRWPYKRWLQANVFDFGKLPEAEPSPPLEGDDLQNIQRSFGYTDESVELLLRSMAETGKEPLGSMGTDTPLAVLSSRAPTLFHYFHQLFAQVTNPPIDPIRESLVMTVGTQIGASGNTFDETPEQCHRLRMKGPLLSNADLARLKGLKDGLFESRVLSLLYPKKSASVDNQSGLALALDQLCTSAQETVADGYGILILSDRGVGARQVAIPSLLALSAVHQHLVRVGTRMEVGLVVEAGDAHEVHDIALLIGYGAAAVNPYLALDTIGNLVRKGRVAGPIEEAQARYMRATIQGLLKVMSKMGISALQSYRGAQIFEAVGLDRQLVDLYFSGTASRLGGIDITDIECEVLERHDRAFGIESKAIADPLPLGGQYHWRRRGELHKWNPATVSALQRAVKLNDQQCFARFCQLAGEEDEDPMTLRGLLELVPAAEPVPLENVESVAAITRRFVSGAMSFGSISAEAHELLAIAMNRIGGRSNSGEGGEESHRLLPDDNGDLRRSAIKQVASGRFGVTAHYLVNADDLQIKIAQGAKPGEGGQLPGHKVDERIAQVRCATPGVTLISPPPHHDIYSIEDLAQLIHDLQAINPTARVSVKLVSEIGIGTVAAGVAKARAGCVVIAGYSGGTGASPLSSIKHAGLPWEIGLAEAQQVLMENGLRGRVRLQVDGGLRTARDIVVAALLGAEEYGVATAALVAEGCILLRKCHLNTCSVGIATQDPELRKAFTGRVEHVVNYFRLLAEEVRRCMARLGFTGMDDMIGRVECLRPKAKLKHPKAAKLDLGPLLVCSDSTRGDATRRQTAPEPWSFETHLDQQVVAQLEQGQLPRKQLVFDLPVRNRDRSVGTLLSGEIVRQHGARGLPDGSIQLNLKGQAGQSLGAFLAAGITLSLEGDANDYVGKGLSGGRIIIRPPRECRFSPEENLALGNTALYGATAGELFACGVAGERFAVRNSGAQAVVEGVGDHCCEYMTGGVVVVLGETGRNFGAGMCGGVAYVFDRQRKLRSRSNMELIELEGLFDQSAIWLLHGMLTKHVALTGSPLGSRILDNWELMLPHFVRVMPTEYRRVLQQRHASRTIPGHHALHSMSTDDVPDTERGSHG